MPRSSDGVKMPHDLFSSHGKQCEINSPRSLPPMVLWGSGGAGCNMGGLYQISPQRLTPEPTRSHRPASVGRTVSARARLGL